MTLWYVEAKAQSTLFGLALYQFRITFFYAKATAITTEDRQAALARVYIFENTEVDDLINSPTIDIEEVYTKGIAEQLVYEKKLIVKELKAHGIHTILTPPKQLSVNTINKYLELKARGLI